MERRTLASSTSSSNNRNSPPPEDAWINTYRKLLPEWQSIAASQQVPYYSIISLLFLFIVVHFCKVIFESFVYFRCYHTYVLLYAGDSLSLYIRI